MFRLFATSNYRHWSAVFAVLLGLVLLTACGRSKRGEPSGEPTAQASELQPIAVAVAEAVTMEAPAFVQATGSFVADETSDVAPEAPGQVVATPVDVGAFVKQGTVIVRLNDRDARLRLQQAEAAEKQAEAALRQAQARLGMGRGEGFDPNVVAEVQAARLAYESADAQARLAETNARRYARLVETGDVSRAVYDQAKTQADTARAQANAARQQLEVAINQARLNNQGIAGAQAALEAARAQTALARKALTDTVITAPFSGFVSDRPVAAGEYVTTSSKIATVLRTNPIKLVLQVPEGEVGRVRVGLETVATVTAFAGREFTGRVTVVNPAIDPNSRTAAVEVQMENPRSELRPNMFAAARINRPEGEAGVYVPRAAVIYDGNTDSSRLYVIEGETARLRVVQTGDTLGDRLRIVTGVQAGEKVATDNLDQLFDGAKVTRR